MNDKGLNRHPHFLATSLIRAWLAGFILLWSSSVRGDTIPTEKSDAVFTRQVEQLTQHRLKDMEKRLRTCIADKEETTSDLWRMRFIRLAMSDPMAPVSAWTLETLGESRAARQGLFFLMPLVRWMSEPFLFPLEIEGAPGTYSAEIQRLMGFMGKLRQQGFGVSLDNVGDASASISAARAYKDYYLALIRGFVKNDAGNELCLSLKLSALTWNLDEALGTGTGALKKRNEIKASLTELLKAASAAPHKKILIRIDMEEYAYKEMTLQVFRETVEENRDMALGASGCLRLGVVIQAYLRDSGRDVKALSHWGRKQDLRVPVRLVKGAYLAHEREMARKEGRKSPVWNHKPSTDACYEALCGYMLLCPDTLVPAFATHNIRSQAHVMALMEALNLEPTTAEFQMLYGMGDPIKDVVVKMGYAMREYVPAGSLFRGLKYAGRRFRELSGSDNALVRTMRGDFSGVEGLPPSFTGDMDMADGAVVLAMFRNALQSRAPVSSSTLLTQ